MNTPHDYTLPRFDQDGGDVLLVVHAVPGASRDRLAGVHGEALKVAVAAPPEKGKANAALAKIIALTFGLRASQVQLERGASSREKVFRLMDCTSEEVRRTLLSVLAS